MKLAVAIQYPTLLTTGKPFATLIKLVAEDANALPEVIWLHIYVSGQNKQTIEFQKERGYLGQAILQLNDMLTSVIEFEVSYGANCFVNSLFVEQHNDEKYGEIICKGCEISEEILRSVKYISLVDCKTIPSNNKRENSETRLIELTHNLKSNFILEPLYALITEHGQQTGLQAFYGKMSIGRGKVNAREDASIRLFEPISERFSETENTLGVAKNIFEHFSRRHCILRFTTGETPQLELMFSRPRYTPLHLSLNGEQQDVNQLTSTGHFRFNIDQHIAPHTSYVEVALSIGNTAYKVDFVGGYHVGQALVLHSTTHPHLGEIVLLNQNISESISLNNICAEIKKSKTSWVLIKNKHTTYEIEHYKLKGVVKATLAT
jgi:hypothetical protein